MDRGVPFTDGQLLTEEQALARLDPGRSRGSSHWPWPNLSMKDCRAALRQFEGAASDILAHGVAGAPLAGDPEVLGLAGYISGMGPLLGHWIATKALAAPADVAETFACHLDHNRARAARMTRDTAAIVAQLASLGIESTVLKGMHTAHAYFPLGTRPAADVDLLVSDGDASRANRYFEDSGAELIARHDFEMTWRPSSSSRAPRTLRYLHRDDPWAIDLHWTLDRRRAAWAPWLRFTGIANPGEAPRLECIGAHVLPQPLLLLYLACHASCDFQNMTLLRQVELALVIRRDSQLGTLQWAEMLAQGERTHLLGAIYPALFLCEKLCPGTVPEHVIARCQARAPAAVARMVRGLTPAGAQRLKRLSPLERFMWAGSPREFARYFISDLFSPGRSASETMKIQRARIRRIAFWLANQG